MNFNLEKLSELPKKVSDVSKGLQSISDAAMSLEECREFWSEKFKDHFTGNEDMEKITPVDREKMKEEQGWSYNSMEAKASDVSKVFKGVSDASMSLEQCRNFWNERFKDDLEDNQDTEKHTPVDREKIKEEQGWSDEIIDAIGSMEEYEIYKKAGLQEAEINGKKCLIRNDIDWEQKDTISGRTNKERAEQGLSPINKDGKVIELHHIGQHADSPLAELTREEHRGRGNDTVLHNKTKESEIDRQAFSVERSKHWEARADEGGN